jgi:hypothetical protein
VAVGDPEWLAAHVAAKKLKRHRIIKADNTHYLHKEPVVPQSKNLN